MAAWVPAAERQLGYAQIIAVVPPVSERCRNRSAEASLFIARRSA